MEAKGCAKPAVWKDARRHFYWAVRARVARSTALAELAEASPGTTFKYRLRLLTTLAFIEPTTDIRAVAEKLEQLDLSQTVTQLKTDYLTRRLIESTLEDRKAMMGGLVRLVDHLSEEDRAALITVLQNAPHPSGMSVSLKFHRSIC